jgi:hypothetical protein
MATTSLNPGVGPTNADIATAVAAPSAATIASAVAAPSAATIATAVAAAVPTISAINSSVASNASPFPAWTAIANGINIDGTTAGTISGLSSYKAIRIYYTYVPNSTSDIFIRFNSDSGANYHTVYNFFANNQNPNGDHRAFSSRLDLGYNASAGQRHAGFIEIENNQSSSGPKIVKGKVFFGNAATVREFEGFYGSNTQISTLTFTSPSNFSDSRIYVVGV